jgi:uncharacterized protein YcnI
MTCHRSRSTSRRRAAIVPGLAAAALIGFAPAASAHVAVDSAAPNGDGTTTITLVWDHSCAPDTDTTGVDVTPGVGVEFTGASTDLAGWSATVDRDRIGFSGPGIPTGQPARVAVTARITATPGTTVTLPSIQHCGDRESAWTDPDPASEHPAPSLIATAALVGSTSVDAGTGGADIGQILTGVAFLAVTLAAVGVVVQRRSAGPG